MEGDNILLASPEEDTIQKVEEDIKTVSEEVQSEKNTQTIVSEVGTKQVTEALQPSQKCAEMNVRVEKNEERESVQKVVREVGKSLLQGSTEEIKVPKATNKKETRKKLPLDASLSQQSKRSPEILSDRIQSFYLLEIPSESKDLLEESKLLSESQEVTPKEEDTLNNVPELAAESHSLMASNMTEEENLLLTDRDVIKEITLEELPLEEDTLKNVSKLADLTASHITEETNSMLASQGDIKKGAFKELPLEEYTLKNVPKLVDESTKFIASQTVEEEKLLLTSVGDIKIVICKEFPEELINVPKPDVESVALTSLKTEENNLLPTSEEETKKVAPKELLPEGDTLKNVPKLADQSRNLMDGKNDLLLSQEEIKEAPKGIKRKVTSPKDYLPKKVPKFGAKSNKLTGGHMTEDKPKTSQKEIEAVAENNENETKSCSICLKTITQSIGEPECWKQKFCLSCGMPENCKHTFCLDCILQGSQAIKECPIDGIQFKKVFIKNPASGEVEGCVSVRSCVLDTGLDYVKEMFHTIFENLAALYDFVIQQIDCINTVLLDTDDALKEKLCNGCRRRMMELEGED